MNCSVCSTDRQVRCCDRCLTPVCAAHAGFAYRDEYRYDKESWVCFASCRGLALVPIKFCMECRQPTTGSIGAAGYYWPRLCQPCKNFADGYVRGQVQAQAGLMRALEHSVV